MAKRPSGGMWEKLKPRAREFRREPTPAEEELWKALRTGRAGDAKFRRQHAIGNFIVDFYCPVAHLVIELDGPIHEHQQERDHERQTYLEALGLNVLRFTNEDVLTDLTRVLQTIRLVIYGPP